MNPEVLIPGLRFAKEHKLTVKEIEVLAYFLEKDYTLSELATILNKSKAATHHLIQKLRLRNLLILKDKNYERNYLFGFNPNQLEN